jgi:hypothetical protein
MRKIIFKNWPRLDQEMEFVMERLKGTVPKQKSIWSNQNFWSPNQKEDMTFEQWKEDRINRELIEKRKKRMGSQ